MIRIYAILPRGLKAIKNNEINEDAQDLTVLRFLRNSQSNDEQIAMFCFGGNLRQAKQSIGRLLKQGLISSDI